MSRVIALWGRHRHAIQTSTSWAMRCVHAYTGMQAAQVQLNRLQPAEEPHLLLDVGGCAWDQACDACANKQVQLDGHRWTSNEHTTTSKRSG